MSVILKICLISFIFNNYCHSQWQPNVCTEQGSITSILQTGDTILAGTRNSGIFKSTNNGDNWNLMTSGLTSFVYSFKLAGGKIFAATDNGLYFSTNRGSNWTLTNNGLLTSIKSVDANQQYIFVGTSQNGVCRSSDNGNNWTQVNDGITNNILWTLITKDNYVFVSTGNGAEGTVFASSNNGDNWNIANQGLPYFSMDVFAVLDNIIFAGGIGIYKTTDFGNTWLNAGISDNTDIRSISVSGNSIVAGGINSGVLRSSNGGVTWSSINNNLPTTNIQSVSIVSNKIFAGTDQIGIYRSTNSGANWYSVNDGISSFDVTDILVHGENIFVGTKRGLYKSSDNGNDWSIVTLGLITRQVINDLSISNNDIYAVGLHDIYKSTNDGLNWVSLNEGFPLFSNRVIAKDNYLLSSGELSDLYRSSNGGANWYVTNVGYPYEDICDALAFKDNNMYVGFKPLAQNGGIYKSTNYGISWLDVSNGLPNRTIFSIASNNNKLYAGIYGKIYFSTNDGSNWTSVSNQLPSNTGFTSFIFNDNAIIAGSIGEGVFVSTNSGANWVAVNSGLGNLNITSLGLKDNIVYAGTSGHGVGLWQRPLSTLVNIQNTTNSSPEYFNLFQNYPNPFNPVTKIKYFITLHSNVKLTLYDNAGKEILTLINEEKLPGEYFYDFNGENLSSGVYFYKMESDGFAETKKMILLK